jgi:hypothetical protein
MTLSKVKSNFTVTKWVSIYLGINHFVIADILLSNFEQNMINSF